MADPMDQVRELVLADVELCRSLADITDRREFTLRLTAVARDHGLALDPAAIDRALDDARRRWRRQWV